MRIDEDEYRELMDTWTQRFQVRPMNYHRDWLRAKRARLRPVRDDDSMLHARELLRQARMP